MVRCAVATGLPDIFFHFPGRLSLLNRTLTGYHFATFQRMPRWRWSRPVSWKTGIMDGKSFSMGLFGERTIDKHTHERIGSFDTKLHICVFCKRHSRFFLLNFKIIFLLPALTQFLPFFHTFIFTLTDCFPSLPHCMSWAPNWNVFLITSCWWNLHHFEFRHRKFVI